MDGSFEEFYFSYTNQDREKWADRLFANMFQQSYEDVDGSWVIPQTYPVPKVYIAAFEEKERLTKHCSLGNFGAKKSAVKVIKEGDLKCVHDSFINHDKISVCKKCGRTLDYSQAEG